MFALPTRHNDSSQFYYLLRSLAISSERVLTPWTIKHDNERILSRLVVGPEQPREINKTSVLFSPDAGTPDDDKNIKLPALFFSYAKISSLRKHKADEQQYFGISMRLSKPKQSYNNKRK